MDAKLVVYSFSGSSCSWRVRFALNLKGLAYEYRAVDLRKQEQLSPEFERLNPLKTVPVLMDADFVLSDSFAILMYLEDKYPKNALLPVDTRRKYLNLQVANIVTSSIQPLHMLDVLKLIEKRFGLEEKLLWTQAQHTIEKGFVALEKLLKDIPGKYATGDEVHMADIFLAPQISIAVTRFKVDMSKFPTLSRIHEECKALPAFQASIPEMQPDAVS
ncbi:hypothetical protein Syun_013095 [Stephania yunnanensis]|uniref:glutathione transferase n=1 Tax=Stephania yunnanensis TaxID=152371 RepID=A0AAP0PJI5_9MAGN